MERKAASSLRDTLSLLRRHDDLLVIDRQVDPNLEVAGITKAVDNSYALLFTNVTGYPDTCLTAGLFSRSDRVARVFGMGSMKELKTAALERLKHPIPPVTVDRAPCQEIIQTEDIDADRSLPITRHTPSDPGPILSGGVVLIAAPGFGKCVSFKRIHFRGKDWASLMCVPGSHADHIVGKYSAEKKRLPITINISPSPAVMAIAGGGLVHGGITLGSDELAIAGGLQQEPVRICPAVTVDALAMADAECVIEGYLDTGEVVWESDESERTRDMSLPFFPEYHGYLGRVQATYKFHATAITRTRQAPIFYLPLAHSFESPRMQVLTNRAFQWGALHDHWPELITDINTLNGMKGRFGLIIQVDKRSKEDDTAVKDIIRAAFETATALRMVVIVDRDVDIYNSDEVIWAICTRSDAGSDLMLLPPAKASTAIREEDVGPFTPVTRMGFDATVPFGYHSNYYRGEYPEVDLNRWLAREQIEKVRARQCDYARLLARLRV